MIGQFGRGGKGVFFFSQFIPFCFHSFLFVFDIDSFSLFFFQKIDVIFALCSEFEVRTKGFQISENNVHQQNQFYF